MSTVAMQDDMPVDPDDELLVAYLDGELNRDQQNELEDRLVDDVALRGRLQQLQSGWDLLDDLPDPAPSLKLVESTLELAVADILKEKPTSDSFWQRFRIPLGIVALSVLGVLGVLAFAAYERRQAYVRQLNDLAIAEHFDA